MSRMTDEAAEQPLPCTAGPAEDRIDVLEARVDTVGAALTIRRALPLRQRRMIGPWCFLDHFGPHEFSRRREGMWVGAHPHIGLQTVTWLMDGEVLHRDSLGTVETIRPGGLNVMTAGRGGCCPRWACCSWCAARPPTRSAAMCWSASGRRSSER